jgi:uracil-DNA glycosylase family 4
MLIKYGVGGSYVTDIVKGRDTARKPTKTEIQKWLPFLIEEINIIQPRTIIVLGKRTYESSFRPFIEPLIPKNIKIDYVFHYCSQVPRVKFEKKFSEVINKRKDKNKN